MAVHFDAFTCVANCSLVCVITSGGRAAGAISISSVGTSCDTGTSLVGSVAARIS